MTGEQLEHGERGEVDGQDQKEILHQHPIPQMRRPLAAEVEGGGETGFPLRPRRARVGAIRTRRAQRPAVLGVRPIKAPPEHAGDENGGDSPPAVERHSQEEDPPAAGGVEERQHQQRQQDAQVARPVFRAGAPHDLSEDLGDKARLAHPTVAGDQVGARLRLVAGEHRLQPGDNCVAAEEALVDIADLRGAMEEAVALQLDEQSLHLGREVSQRVGSGVRHTTLPRTTGAGCGSPRPATGRNRHSDLLLVPPY